MAYLPVAMGPFPAIFFKNLLYKKSSFLGGVRGA